LAFPNDTLIDVWVLYFVLVVVYFLSWFDLWISWLTLLIIISRSCQFLHKWEEVHQYVFCLASYNPPVTPPKENNIPQSYLFTFSSMVGMWTLR
jgi:hypothetical protein